MFAMLHLKKMSLQLYSSCLVSESESESGRSRSRDRSRSRSRSRNRSRSRSRGRSQGRNQSQCQSRERGRRRAEAGTRAGAGAGIGSSLSDRPSVAEAFRNSDCVPVTHFNQVSLGGGAAAIAVIEGTPVGRRDGIGRRRGVVQGCRSAVIAPAAYGAAYNGCSR